MISGKAHCMTLLFILRDRQLDPNAQVIEENVVSVFLLLCGAMIRFLKPTYGEGIRAFCSEIC